MPIYRKPQFAKSGRSTAGRDRFENDQTVKFDYCAYRITVKTYVQHAGHGWRAEFLISHGDAVAETGEVHTYETSRATATRAASNAAQRYVDDLQRS